MFKKLSETFTATHATILGVVAMLVPGALLAVPASQRVAIVDPVSGRSSYVDPGERLWVYDQIGGYAATPANFIDIKFLTSTDTSGGRFTSCSAAIYTVPAGKALVIRAISGFIYRTGLTPNAGFGLAKDSACLKEVTEVSTGVSGASPMNILLGTGVAIPTGTSLYTSDTGSTVSGYIHGYLVPAAAVPAG